MDKRSRLVAASHDTMEQMLHRLNEQDIDMAKLLYNYGETNEQQSIFETTKGLQRKQISRGIESQATSKKDFSRLSEPFALPSLPIRRSNPFKNKTIKIQRSTLGRKKAISLYQSVLRTHQHSSRLNSISSRISSPNKSINLNSLQISRTRQTVKQAKETLQQAKEAIEQEERRYLIPEPLAHFKPAVGAEEETSSEEEEIPLIYYWKEYKRQLQCQCSEQINYLYFSKNESISNWSEGLLSLFEKHDKELVGIRKKCKYLEKFDQHFFSVGIYRDE